jgi:formylglycine-generating enzyme required for sulfatase activity
MAKDNRTHSIIYFSKTSGDYILSTPKLWAHANSHHFSGKKFPTVNAIEKYLKNNYGFKEATTEKTVMLYNFIINIPLFKDKSFI